MKTVIENYINGNLKDAKEGAKQCSLHRLRKKLREDYGYSCNAANAIASYLKGAMGFQTCCDIVYAEKI